MATSARTHRSLPDRQPVGDRADGRQAARRPVAATPPPITSPDRARVVPEGDLDEVGRRAGSYVRDLGVLTDIGRDLARQMAVMSVRMDRCASHEAMAIAHNRRHAIDRHDDGRQDEADRLFATLGEDPRGNLRRLKRMPEGVDRLVEAWRGLRAELNRKPRPRWTAWHREQAENLTGNRLRPQPVHRDRRPLRGDLGTALRPAR